MPLSLNDANKVIDKAHAKAKQLGIKVTVAVVDEGGLLVSLARMDGAMPLTPQLADRAFVALSIVESPEAQQHLLPYIEHGLKLA